MRLDLWAAVLAAGIVVGTVAPDGAPAVVAVGLVVGAGALVWRDLAPPGWRVMAAVSPVFLAGGIGIAAAHAGAPDPLKDLAELEPGGVTIVGKVSSPPVL